MEKCTNNDEDDGWNLFSYHLERLKPKPKPCVNKHNGCENWSKQGECKKNRDWMSKNCCKACQGKYYWKAPENAFFYKKYSNKEQHEKIKFKFLLRGLYYGGLGTNYSPNQNLSVICLAKDMSSTFFYQILKEILVCQLWNGTSLAFLTF